MKSMLALCILAASLGGLAPLAAQDQNSEVVPVGPDKFLRWFGHAGRTYFVQISDPNEPLHRWIWAPIIETGNALEISYEVDGTADKGFFRLWFTDEPTVDPDHADFDGDGLDNLAEVSLHQTNPLKADTDGDGLPDAWELAHAVDPNDDGSTNAHHGSSGDPDGDGLTNSEELALAIHPNSADSDGDGSGDRVEANAGADPASPLSTPLRWISAGRGGATMATPPYIYSSWDSNFQTGSYWPISTLMQALSTLGFPTSVPTSPLGGFGVGPIGSGSLGEPADYDTSPAGSGEMYQKCYWLEVRPPTPVEIRRSALKVTRTYHDGVEKDPVFEQVEFTIPAGGTLSNRIDLVPALPTFPQGVSEIHVVQDLIQVEVRDIKDHADENDDVEIANWNTSQTIAEENIAWIEAHTSATNSTPRMPQLELIITGLPENTTLEAKMLVEYERPYAGKQSDDTVKIPTDGSFQTVSNGQWKIWNNYAEIPFFGGDATITYRLNGETEHIIRFAIGDRNPDDTRCKAYTQSRPAAPWYAYAIEKHESQAYNPGFYNQFWERSGDSSAINNGVNYAFTRGDALVVRSSGETGVGGAGLAQVTGLGGDKTTSAPREVFWNWQKNVGAYLDILASRIQIAETFMNNPDPRSSTNPMPDGQRPQTIYHTGNNLPVPSREQGLATFGDNQGEKRPEDAIAIKAYNGATAHWCSWRGPSVHEWQFNYGQNNYVHAVCNQLEP